MAYFIEFYRIHWEINKPFQNFANLSKQPLIWACVFNFFNKQSILCSRIDLRVFQWAKIVRLLDPSGSTVLKSHSMNKSFPPMHIQKILICLITCTAGLPNVPTLSLSSAVHWPAWCKVTAVQTSPVTAIVYSLHVLQLLYSCWMVWSWDTLWLPQNLVIDW